jgi:hypothetical protein
VGSPSQEAKSANLIVLDGEGTAQGLSSEDIFQHAARTILLKSQSVDHHRPSTSSIATT